MTAEQLTLGIVIVGGIVAIVWFMKGRITSFRAGYGKGRVDIKASEPEAPRAGIRAHGVEAGRDATIANRAGDGVDAEKVKAARDATITNDPAPPKP